MGALELKEKRDDRRPSAFNSLFAAIVRFGVDVLSWSNCVGMRYQVE